MPGLLAGAAHLLDEFGTMRLSEVVDPALALAEEGFKTDRYYADACKKAVAQIRKNPKLLPIAQTLHRSLLRNGKPPQKGELVQRPELAAALRLIAMRGVDAVYDGQIGDAILSGNHTEDSAH